MWIFGYGSLVWYTNFPYERALSGTVRGFSRRFHQASPDHRGTHEQPGRTVTLVKDDGKHVWGVAYKVPQEKAEEVRQYLDWREKAGYETQTVLFHPDHPQDMQVQTQSEFGESCFEEGLDPFHLNVYIATTTGNPYYLGPRESIEMIAERVVKCVGPSGTNIEYVLRLAHSVRTRNPQVQDDHLFQLEKLVVELCKKRQINDPTLKELGHI